MDKNIAALLREDAKTIRVVFDSPAANVTWVPASTDGKGVAMPAGTATAYTYVTHLDVEVGDAVVVPTAGQVDKMKLATVVEVDTEVKIEPNSDIKFKWVAAKVDLVQSRENDERNAEIERTVSDAYRNNLRRSFAQQILAGVDPSRQGELQKLIGGKDA